MTRLWLVDGVQAHGGGALQIANAPVGECLVSVWLAPTVPRANKPLHVTVGLAEATNQAPILDGEVQVMIREVASGEQVSAAPATTAQSVKSALFMKPICHRWLWVNIR
ncbi:MAG: hypothetical protein HC804_03595 [Anaerolineae bacterium]|nr:hypothetical protein [Anaerolineae bacterium]